MPECLTEPARQIPLIGQYDVVVIGGGVAGVAAAVAAARGGASALLVEKHCVLGGLATQGMVAIFLPLCDGRGRQVVAGLAEEMLLLTARHAPADIPAAWRAATRADAARHSAERRTARYLSHFAPHPYMIALEELALEAGVTLAYDTRLCDVIVKGGRIDAVVVENKTGRCAIRGRVFIDASGDADLCVRAGQPTTTHRDNARAAWYSSFDGQRLRLIANHVSFTSTPPEEPLFAGDTHEDVTQMLVRSRPLIMKSTATARAQSGNPDIYPAIISTIPLYRVTRTLADTSEFDTADAHRWREDAIAISGDWREPGPVHAIGYGSLVASRLANLLVAGRCVAATRPGAEITRAIPGCVATGQAAGTAAALALGDGIDLRRLNVPLLQSRLRRDKVILDPDLLLLPTATP